MEAVNVVQGDRIAERELAGVIKQFEEWRTNRRKIERIPEALWQSATALHPSYSVCRIARALRLNFVELRDRIHSAAKAAGRANRKSKLASAERLHFMELPTTAVGGGQSECQLKVRNGGRGTRITLRFKGSGVGQLLETLRGLWGAGQ